MISGLFVNCSTEALYGPSGTYPAIVSVPRTLSSDGRLRPEYLATPYCQVGPTLHSIEQMSEPLIDGGYCKSARPGISANTVARSRPFFRQ
jgi:hypothetical protein